MLLIFWGKNLKVYISKVRKYKKNANDGMYRHFREVLRVVLLQVSFSRPSLMCVSIFRRFGGYEYYQLWPKYRITCPTIVRQQVTRT